MSVIGIDLGTCFSAAAHVINGTPEIIPNKHGNRITPSVAAFSRDEILIGEDADYIKDDPDFIFIEKSKVLIGSDHIYNTPMGPILPQDVAFYILKHIIDYSSDFIGHKITKVVVTVPAYFNAYQRKLTKQAAERTGVEVMRIISEPTAASLMTAKVPEGSNVLVYDLGGGTFDCSILEMNNGWARVISTNGNTNLGGKNFDECIAKYFVQDYENLNIIQKNKLLRLSEIVKKTLTTRNTAFLPLNEVIQGAMPINVTYGLLKSITRSLMDTTKHCVFNCMKDAELEQSNIHKILMVGGSSRMKMVFELLQSIFDVKPEILGNPDEVVALGCAAHAYDISGMSPATLLIDAIPLSIGVKLENGICKKVMYRNSPIPGESEEIFTTAYDNQEKVIIEVFQGENELSKNNVFLGTLELTGIEKATRGTPKIIVTFSVDSDAVLSIKARDLKTNVESSATFSYDTNNQVPIADEEQEILILNLKAEIENQLKIPNIDESARITAIEAMNENNIELLQSVMESLRNDF